MYLFDVSIHKSFQKRIPHPLWQRLARRSPVSFSFLLGHTARPSTVQPPLMGHVTMIQPLEGAEDRGLQAQARHLLIFLHVSLSFPERLQGLQR